MINFIAQDLSVDAAGPDNLPRRTITGVAVPYGVDATVSDGTTVRILAGALPIDGTKPRLFQYHDSTQPVGIVTERVSTETAMLFTAKVSATRAGDEALILAADGVFSVSIGINPTKWHDDKGVMVFKVLVEAPRISGALRVV